MDIEQKMNLVLGFTTTDIVLLLFYNFIGAYAVYTLFKYRDLFKGK